jgi:predicted nuclease of predicted toxin-antitoxin system
VKFFFDNNLAAKIAKGLNGFVSPDHQVVHLKEQFAANAEDTVWMRQLARQEDWIIVTADVRIGKNPHEIAAWKEAGHTIFS